MAFQTIFILHQMKIWIDLTNSPHINFFKPFINQWKAEGYEMIITCRDLANTIQLIEQNGWDYTEVGGHAGKSSIKKVLYFPRRVWELRKFLKKHKPSIGISHSSFYSPVVAKLLGVPSIYINDNEHAQGNYIAFRYATLNLVPESLSKRAEELEWGKKYGVKLYPGIKEGIYLAQSKMPTKATKPDNVKKKIFVRLAPWTAQYYTGDNYFFDDILKELQEDYEIVLLPRDKTQTEHFEKEEFSKITIARKPLKLEQVYEECDLFIGAGGTMTRELAFLGIPTISIYQDELLEVDKFLIQEGYMTHKIDLTRQDIEQSISSAKHKENDLILKGHKAFNLINEYVKEHAKH